MSLRSRFAQIMLASNFGMVGSASEVVPRETSGIREDRHGGCAPVSDEEAPSVATNQEADPPNLRVMPLDLYAGFSAHLK